MKKHLQDSLVIGFALFSMFFGAGNVIFPPYLGLESGPEWLVGFSSYFMADIGLALLAMFAIPYAFASLLQLGALGYSRSYMLLPLIFSFSTDTCAFFAGHAFGKHKLAPHVSPHKTVEGALGGIAGSVTGGLLFALVVNTWGDGSISYPLIALVGVLISLAAQLGDLSFSLIKREFGVKDYGHIFLAHGGVLDRFDSVSFAAPTLLVRLQLLRL